MTTSALASTSSFVRTRSTWLSYALLACFGFALSLPGPIMPFLAAKFALTFTEIGYYFALMSAGIVFISLTGDRIAKQIGNDQLAWGAAALIGIALLGVTFGNSPAVTMFCMFLYGGAIGAVVLVTFTAIAIASGQHAAKAYAEANIVASIAGTMGPLLAGVIARSPFGWSAIALLPLIVVAFLKISFWGLPLPTAQPVRNNASHAAENAGTHPLPLRFWLFGVLMFLGAGMESLITTQGARYFTIAVGLDMSTSATVMSIFAIAGVLGRVIGRRLLDFIPASRLLVISLVWVLLSFPIYWLSTLPLLNIVGMFLIGLGSGNLGPICTSSAMTAAGEATNRASAKFGLFPPMGIFIMVQIFSFLSDQFGMQRAYTLMVVTLMVAIVIALIANRFRRSTAS